MLTDDNVAPRAHCRVSGHVPASLAAVLPTACSDPQFEYESSRQLPSDPLPSDAQQLYSAQPDGPHSPSDPVLHILRLFKFHEK